METTNEPDALRGELIEHAARRAEQSALAAVFIELPDDPDAFERRRLAAPRSWGGKGRPGRGGGHAKAACHAEYAGRPDCRRTYNDAWKPRTSPTPFAGS